MGAYSAQVVANFDLTNGSNVITVWLTVAPGGVNPEGLAATPSGLVFLPDAAASQTITVMNAPGITGPMPFTTFATSTGWLYVTQIDPKTPGLLKVSVDANGLRPGIHTGTVTITSATRKSTVVPVSVLINEAGIGPTIALTPAQKSLTFNFQTGTTSNPQQTVYVSSGSTQYTYFTATTSEAWLGVSSASWTTPARAANCFAPGLFYASVDPTGLTPGVYTGSLTLAGGGSSVEIPVKLTVSSTPVLNANPSFISLDAATSLLTSNLAVTASDSFYITATVSMNTGWLSVSPTTAVASNNTANLTVTANATGLPGGTYNGTITLAGPSGQPTLAVPVQLKVTGGNTANTVSISPASLDFFTIAGDLIPPQSLFVNSAIGTPSEYLVAATSEGGWLSVDPLLGATPLRLNVSANPATPAGTYTGSIVVTSLTTGDQATAAVTLNSTARTMSATPASLRFAQSFQGPAPAAQEVQVTANARSGFRVTTPASWIKVQPAGPLTTPVKLIVTADPAGMAPGQYQDTIQLIGPNSIALSVALTVDAPPAAAATPSTVSFSHEIGSPAPTPQTVTVTNPAVATTFNTTVSTSSATNWLEATPASGSTPGVITLSVNTARLTPGQHSGTVAVSFGNTALAPLTISVNLAVTGTPVQVRQVLNAATGAPTSIAPGQVVTLTGFGLGPAAAAVARPTAAGAFGADLAGVRVSFDGVPAPLLYVQDSQINAIVPYALEGRASARLQVQVDASYSVPIDVTVAAAAPGIFTAGAAGRGQAAALNADLSPNSVLNPAQRGSVIVVYMTGEGSTDPPGQDGRVINSDLRKPAAQVTASIGNRPADVLYAGSAPSLVAGICQVNIRIPESVDPGTQPIEIHVGAASTQRGVTIELR